MTLVTNLMTNSAVLPRADAAILPPGERQDLIKNIFVGHDRFTEAFDAIKRFHMPVKGGRPDTGAVGVLAGESRTGKTFALEMYARSFPAIQGENGMIRPVVYVDMPSEGGFRSVLQAVADALNVPHTKSMDNGILNKLIQKALLSQQVQLLLLDEFQEVFDISKKAMIAHGRGFLRKILNLGSLNILCAGLLQTYEQMAGDPQLTGRGNLPYKIVRPYDWANDDDRQLFRLLCDSFDDKLPFAERSGLRREAIAQRLHWVSNGNIGRLKTFIYQAGCLAINDASDRITLDHFAAAYDWTKPLGSKFHPFRDDMSQAPVPSEKPDLQEIAANSNALTKKAG